MTMEKLKCKICRRLTKAGTDDLCLRHQKMYKYDKAIDGYRLKKKENGSSTRYVAKKFHSHEIELVKVVEKYYGPKNVVTGYHPLWAVSDKKALLEYDVFVPSLRLLIEYNGEQHYKFTPYFHKNKARFLDQQRRDRRKAELAKENNYLLIVFKYNEPLFEDYVVSKIKRETNGSTNTSAV